MTPLSTKKKNKHFKHFGYSFAWQMASFW